MVAGMTARSVVGMVSALGVLCGSAFGQASYTVTDLGVLPGPVPTGGASQAMSLSQTGTATTTPVHVVGWSTGATNTGLPFIWNQATGMRDASLGLAASGVATDIRPGNLDYVGFGVPRIAPTPGTRGFHVMGLTGTLRWLGTLGGANSEAHAIGGPNTALMIVGSAQRADGATRAALWGASNTPVDLGTLGGKQSEALGVNASGFIVGRAQNAAGVARAFVYNPMAASPLGMRDLGSLAPHGSSMARDINNAGQIVGVSQFVNSSTSPVLRGSRAVMWNPTSLAPVNLGVLRPTDPASEALGNNNHGHIVGWSGYPLSSTSTHVHHQRAFIHKDGVMKDLNTLIPAGSGWHLMAATEINDAGQIVGWGMKFVSGTTAATRRAFLLTPVAGKGDAGAENVPAVRR